MTPERWRQVEEVFQAALDRPVSDRSSYLDDACAGDSGLRTEVESLLQQQDSDNFIAKAVSSAAENLAVSGTQNYIGKQIGAFHIDGFIGRGGMAEWGKYIALMTSV
jgi:eukaryotic-like serine/threonine-protein kinase